jgi:methylase of polypeptide subunit release factors
MFPMSRTAPHKTTGAVYTPAPIVAEIYARAGDLPGRRWADLSCGDGAFLLPLVGMIVAKARLENADPRRALEDRLFGNDIDADAVAACRARLDAEAASFGVRGVRWNLSAENAATRAFLARWRGTFDAIVGNPPYVRIQNLDPETRAFLQGLPATGRGATDLFLGFVEISLEMLRPGGRLLYLMPNSWLRSQAGRGLRALLARTGAVRAIHDYRDRQIFPNATTYVAVLDAEKDGGRPSFLYTDASRPETPQTREVPAADLDQALPRLGQGQADAETLGQICRISTGIATLADGYFIGRLLRLQGDEARLQTKFGEISLESGILRPVIKASTLAADDLDQGLRVLFPYARDAKGRMSLIAESDLADRFPKAYAYLRAIRPVLDARDKGVRKAEAWYAFGRRQSIDGLYGPKIVTAPLAKEAQFRLHRSPDALMLSGYCVIPPPGVDLAALRDALNTPETTAFVRAHGRSYQGGYVSFGKAVLDHLPLTPALRRALRLT